MPSVPHLAVPIRLLNGEFATVQQDTLEEVRQCVLACLQTPRGSRIDAPEYGIPTTLLFSQGDREPNIASILAAVEDSEPRAHLLGRAELEDLTLKVAIGIETAVA